MTRLAVLLALALTVPASDQLQQNIQRIFTGKALEARTFGPARWIRNGAAFTTVEPSPSDPAVREIVEYDTATGKRTPLVTAAQLTPKDAKPLAIDDYWWDSSMRRLLLFTNSRKYWRTNSLGDYWVLTLATGQLQKLGGPSSPASSLMYATFSPDGSRVAYVRAGNLYVEDLASASVTALTSDGSATLVNGASDWVYEEELNLRQAFRWSPDGRNIAFWQFDESGVETFTIINNTDALYPKLLTFPYPKSGTRNPSVRIGIIASSGGSPRWLPIPGDPRDNYLFRMDWIDAQRLAIGQLNRRQNHVTIFTANASTAAVTPTFEDHDDTWVDLPESAGAARDGESLRWIRDRKAFLWLSERDGWRRAYAVPLDKSAPAAISPDDLDVIEITAATPDSRWLYYLASPANATERYLYRSPLNAPGPAERITPNSQPGTHEYDVSPDARWAFHTYSTFDSPPAVDLVSIPDLQQKRSLELNAELRANAASLLSAPAEFIQVRVSDNATLDGWIIRPRDFDATRKYPVVVHVYGEPFGQTVTNKWQGQRGLFHRALAAAGYVVVSFDNRGTPAPKGRAWRKSIYGMVGVLSSKDQTDALINAAKSRPWLDLTRVGVWGWSGGGTNTLNLMFRSPDLYRVGISVAPVPDQTLYDTIYQERYMRTPQDNPEGYAASSAIHHAAGLQGKLLIIHGTGDDNVHYQGAERLINRLIELGKRFDMMSYPNRSHSISEGPGTSSHLYSRVARYLEEHLSSYRLSGPK